MDYTLTLTESERQALAWIAARYECARVLYDGMKRTADAADDAEAVEYHIPEHVAWAYAAELEIENGGGLFVPPCAGGTLAEKLLAFYAAIV